jgi:hypothetical protein
MKKGCRALVACDLFVNIEGMAPGEYKNGGEHLQLHYSFAETPSVIS